jgi:sporulation protein YlmC with PRC-barrel domain
MHGTRGCARELFPGKEGFLFLDVTNSIGGHKMLKTLMISAAVSALMVSGALAQADMSPKQQPAAKADAIPHDTAKFIAAQGTDQWVFSKFKGTDVIGPDNAQVGNVNDMLFDKSGKIIGLIVGVGGFLGIGEKSVAIDMSAFQPVPADTGSSTSGAAGGNAAIASRNDDPTMVKLKVSWTKDQLKSAPDFQYYKSPARTTGGPGASPTTGMAPRPTPPAGR